MPGIYFCDWTVVDRAKALKPSKRGELEIVDLLKSYLLENGLGVELLNRGYAWIDSGSPDTLLDSSNFIASIERRQGLKIGCIEEISFRNGWIDKNQLNKLADDLGNNEYANYLREIGNNP